MNYGAITPVLMAYSKLRCLSEVMILLYLRAFFVPALLKLVQSVPTLLVVISYFFLLWAYCCKSKIYHLTHINSERNSKRNPNSAVA